MREMHMITAIMAGMGLSSTTAQVTDGCFSGSGRGACIGYVSPEAVLGGPIALVQDGNSIHINIEQGVLDLHLPAEELARRRESWRPPEPPDKGILDLYARLATSTNRGAGWQMANQS